MKKPCIIKRNDEKYQGLNKFHYLCRIEKKLIQPFVKGYIKTLVQQ